MTSYDGKIIKDTILEYMRICKNFTALDISNSLKATHESIRYRDVAEAVREMYDLGMIRSLGYFRELVEVTTTGGTTVQSYLYTYNPAYFAEISKGSALVQPQATEDILVQGHRNKSRISKTLPPSRQSGTKRIA